MSNFRGAGRTLHQLSRVEVKKERVHEHEHERGQRCEGEGPVTKRRKILRECDGGDDGGTDDSGDGLEGDYDGGDDGGVGDRGDGGDRGGRNTTTLRNAAVDAGGGSGDVAATSTSASATMSIPTKREKWLRSLERRISPPLRMGRREGRGNDGGNGGGVDDDDKSKRVESQRARIRTGRVAKDTEVDVTVESETEVEVEVEADTEADSGTDSGSSSGSDVQITKVLRKGQNTTHNDASYNMTESSLVGSKTGPKAKQDKSESENATKNSLSQAMAATKVIPSPIQLTRIRDLPPQCNVDTVSLKDILGDPLIRECWQFNFCLDLDFIMNAFDEDVKDLVQVRVVHGFWKREDGRIQALEAQAAPYRNLRLIAAHMPEPFGTHHTKMMILLRHDNSAQVVVHTANMIPQDWANMTQAVWRSPLLPLTSCKDGSATGNSMRNRREHVHGISKCESGSHMPIGSGPRFKHDLLRYLQAYGSRTASVVSELRKYDFGAVRGAFVASVPGRVPDASKSNTAVTAGVGVDAVNSTAWGWQGLRQVLESVECEDDYSDEDEDDETDSETNSEDSGDQKKGNGHSKTNTSPQINVQVSSIASLGAKDTWLKAFINVLSASASSSASSKAAPAKSSLTTNSESKGKSETPKTQFASKSSPSPSPVTRIIWPTVTDVGNSLNGYASGGSIHMRLKSATASKQMEYLRPCLFRWSTAKKPLLAMLREGYENESQSISSSVNGGSTSAATGPLIRDIKPSMMLEGGDEKESSKARTKGKQPLVQGKAFRNLAAPHIKTYIRFSRRGNIDWALVTSANLSTQAWGAGKNKTDGSVRVCSWEAGVLVWPGLWETEAEAESVKMERVEDGGGKDREGKDIERKTKRAKGRRRRRAKMMPAFGQDTPSMPFDISPASSDPSFAEKTTDVVTVAFRMPYDMPLIPYAAGDEPWSADQLHAQPDWRGVVWDPSLLKM